MNTGNIPNMKYTVIHFAETIKGGIATYLSSLLEKQVITNTEANIILVLPLSQKKEIVDMPDIEFFYFIDTSNRLLNSIKLVFKAIQVTKIFKPNIIHVHSFFAGLLIRPIFAFNKSIKIIYCPHGWSFDRKSGYLFKKISIFIELFLSLFSDAIICISDHEMSIAIKNKLPSKKLITIKNAVNIEYFNKSINILNVWPKNKLKLLFVGRFDRQKGLDIFLNSLNFLQDEAHAVIIGSNVLGDDGNIQKDYTSFGSTTFVGWKTQNELIDYYHAADLIIIPSRWEGFGLVAIEAMSCGLPVIASKVGGLAEIIVDYETGRLYENDSSVALTKILKEITNEDLRKMSINSVKRVRNLYDISRLDKEISILYSNLLKT